MPSKMRVPEDLAGLLMLVCAGVFAVATVTILAAHVFERIGGYAPCPLCLEERYAYYFGVPASFVAFFAA
ncbi:MAG TPA: disulfide bond formation protein B, partial [Methyloceanibacter sp.]